MKVSRTDGSYAYSTQNTILFCKSINIHFHDALVELTVLVHN